MRRDLVPIANPPEKRSACAELSFFNVVMAATHFRRAARSHHPTVVRDIGREYLAKAGWTTLTAP